MTLARNSDIGAGPCVDTRAYLANAALANEVVSIPGDGSFLAGARLRRRMTRLAESADRDERSARPGPRDLVGCASQAALVHAVRGTRLGFEQLC